MVAGRDKDRDRPQKSVRPIPSQSRLNIPPAGAMPPAGWIDRIPLPPLNAEHPPDLWNAANRALLRAKEAGKNRVVMATHPDSLLPVGRARRGP